MEQTRVIYYERCSGVMVPAKKVMWIIPACVGLGDIRRNTHVWTRVPLRECGYGPTVVWVYAFLERWWMRVEYVGGKRPDFVARALTARTMYEDVVLLPTIDNMLVIYGNDVISMETCVVDMLVRRGDALAVIARRIASYDDNKCSVL